MGLPMIFFSSANVSSSMWSVLRNQLDTVVMSTNTKLLGGRRHNWGLVEISGICGDLCSTCLLRYPSLPRVANHESVKGVRLQGMKKFWKPGTVAPGVNIERDAKDGIIYRTYALFITYSHYPQTVHNHPQTIHKSSENHHQDSILVH
eukprot:79593-Amorphochlora_amoeboformis.AAC.2